MKEPLGSLALCRSGAPLLAPKSGIHRLDPRDGALAQVAAPEPDLPTNRLNDGKASPEGRFLVGSMDDRPEKAPTAAPWRLDPGATTCVKLAEGLTVSNGLAWSPDGRTLWHSDSRASVIWTWRYDPATGAISDRHEVARPTAAIGRPDGGATDAEGGYWSAGVSAGRLNRWLPDGTLDRVVELPLRAPTMPCFGGPGLRTLYVTNLRPEGAGPDDGRLMAFLMQAGPPGVSGWAADISASVTSGTRNWLFVKVETDAGITGIGEGSGWPRVVEAALHDLAHVVVGQDAFDTGRLWQRMHVAIMGHGMSGVVGHGAIGAIGAIDMALWDIKGKALGVPVWQLLGGRVRDRVRAYAHASTPEQARDAVAKGYRAIKTGGVSNPAAKAAAIRGAVGDGVDLMVDLHGPPWLTAPDAIAVCAALEPLAPLFVEEPLAPEDIEGYRRLRTATRVPVAAGERHGGLHGIAPLLLEGLVDVAQPDAGRAGGITGLRKIAALAEARFATVAPHAGSLGPVAEFAALHLLAAIPNALILEKMDPDWPGRALVVSATPELRDGHLLVPEAPGLGVEIDEAFVAAHPSQRNVGLPKGGWPEGTEGAGLYAQPRHPRAPSLKR